MTAWMAGVDATAASADERAALAEGGARPGEVLIETCHRVEVYGTGEPRLLALPGGRRAPVRTGVDAVRHLCRVAAGLESASVGEFEVLGQVRAALDRAVAGGAVDPSLARLFQVAIAGGRRARSLAGPPSPGLAATAVLWLGARTDLRSAPVLVAGRGTMGTALARALSGAGAEVVVATRNPRGAQRPLAAAAADADASRFAAIAVALSGSWVDLARPPAAPIADLSSPPAVPAPVRHALGDAYLGIDDLFRMRPDAGLWSRRAEAAVEAAVGEYQTWLAARGAGGVIEPLLDRVDRRRRARLEAAIRRLGELDARQVRLLDQLSRQLVADVLHEPLRRIRNDSSGAQEERARGLFDL